jgi:hypothetical protein
MFEGQYGGDYADAAAGKMVRFYLPDVLQELREKAKTSKRGRTRKLQPPMNTNKHE